MSLVLALRLSELMECPNHVAALSCLTDEKTRSGFRNSLT